MMVVIGRRIGEHLEHNLPNLDTLILTGNNIQELGDLDVLSSVPTLTTLRSGLGSCVGLEFKIGLQSPWILIHSDVLESFMESDRGTAICPHPHPTDMTLSPQKNLSLSPSHPCNFYSHRVQLPLSSKIVTSSVKFI